MKTPRISDFHPDAKAHTLKSPLDSMPVIEKPSAPKKRLNTEGIANELKGNSAFFPDYKQEVSPAPTQDDPVLAKPTNVETTTKTQPAPQGVPPTVRGTGPRTPKVKRAIRQRQPFDIFEDQYTRLKQIAEAERKFVDGRGMSQMVREAIDLYLKERFPSKD
jgi:hypothetical protein